MAMAHLEQQQQQQQQQHITQQSITELTGHRTNVDPLFANVFLSSLQGQGIGGSSGISNSGVYSNCPVEQQQQMSLPSMSVSQTAPPLYVPTTHSLLNPSPVGATYPQQPGIGNTTWSLGGDNRQYGATSQCYSSPLPAWPRPEHGYGDSVQRQGPSLSPLTSYMRPDVGSWSGYGQSVGPFTPQFPRTAGTCVTIGRYG